MNNAGPGLALGSLISNQQMMVLPEHQNGPPQTYGNQMEGHYPVEGVVSAPHGAWGTAADMIMSDKSDIFKSYQQQVMLARAGT